MAGLDIIPVAPAGRQIIQSYGDGAFRISQVRHEGAVVVLQEETLAWPVADLASLDIVALEPVTSRADDFDILLIGCGERFAPPPKGLRQAVKDAGLVLDWMDTGAACRTFNVLQSEDRRVVAALLPVG